MYVMSDLVVESTFSLCQQLTQDQCGRCFKQRDIDKHVCLVFSLSDEIPDSSDEEETDGNYNFFNKKNERMKKEEEGNKTENDLNYFCSKLSF